LHSWVGGLTISLFASNLVGGTLVFLFPGMSPGLRALVLPFHVFNGVSILALIAVSVVSGITEKAFFMLGSSYSELPRQALLLNFLGLTVVLFALTAGFVVSRPQFKRRPLVSEQEVAMEETSHSD